MNSKTLNLLLLVAALYIAVAASTPLIRSREFIERTPYVGGSYLDGEYNSMAVRYPFGNQNRNTNIKASQSGSSKSPTAILGSSPRQDNAIVSNKTDVVQDTVVTQEKVVQVPEVPVVPESQQREVVQQGPMSVGLGWDQLNQPSLVRAIPILRGPGKAQTYQPSLVPQGPISMGPGSFQSYQPSLVPQGPISMGPGSFQSYQPSLVPQGSISMGPGSFQSYQPSLLPQGPISMGPGSFQSYQPSLVPQGPILMGPGRAPIYQPILVPAVQVSLVPVYQQVVPYQETSVYQPGTYGQLVRGTNDNMIFQGVQPVAIERVVEYNGGSVVDPMVQSRVVAEVPYGFNHH